MINTFKKWFLLLGLSAMLFSFFYFDLHSYLTFSTLKKYQILAQTWAKEQYFLTLSLYLFFFTLLIACTIPCATFLSIVGGFLFGAIAVIYAMTGTTLGGVLLYFSVRTALGKFIANKSVGWIKKIEKKFQENAFTYLLMMRLVPVFPCWISNISAGMLNVPLKTFVAATLLGIFPSTVVYVLVGRGLDRLFEVQQTPDLKILLTPSLFFPLLGLALISMIPIFYKHFIKRK